MSHAECAASGTHMGAMFVGTPRHHLGMEGEGTGTILLISTVPTAIGECREVLVAVISAVEVGSRTGRAFGQEEGTARNNGVILGGLGSGEGTNSRQHSIVETESQPDEANIISTDAIIGSSGTELDTCLPDMLEENGHATGGSQIEVHMEEHPILDGNHLAENFSRDARSAR